MLILSQVEDVQIISRGKAETGTLHLTAHHLIFTLKPPPILRNEIGDQQVKTVRPRELWITYPIIAHCTFRPTPPGSGLTSSIRLRGRDFTFITFNFVEDKQARDVFESIKSLTCKLGSIEKLYAFSYKAQPIEQEISGWDIYDAKAEWSRQGISEKGKGVLSTQTSEAGWRISKINLDYSFSPTYPALLVVPSSISDNVLNYAGRYRSRVRIPVLTYLHPVNNCSITRSSQPLAGLRGNRSIQDERLVSACFSAISPHDASGFSTPAGQISPETSQHDISLPELTETEKQEDELISAAPKDGKTEKGPIYGAQQHNLIVDARPTVNALAMQAIGLGSENMDHYKFATKAYLGIDNIHVMRESLNKVIEAIKDSDITPLPPNRELLAKSNWLKHITGLLDGSGLIARQVGLQHSHVLIHCSDGWDRTSQLSALAQILLDPYYRTLEGFIVLVEKDWLSFGHMFQHRTGFLNSEKWFVTQNEGLAGSTIQPGGNNEGRGDAIENALANAKRFFTKNNRIQDDDSDGEMLSFEDQTAMSKKDILASENLAKSEATKPKETSPVFHQFLDATYQLLRQHPTRFEFNERFLRRLLYHLYSCQYGTFLYNNEKARRDAGVQEKTRSVWDYFLSRKEEFLNKEYDGGVVDDHEKGKERLIFPMLDKVRWWHSVFGRTDEEMNGIVNTVSEKYLSGTNTPTSSFSSSKNPGKSVLTGVETANTSIGLTPNTTPLPKTSPPATERSTSGGFAGLREGIAGLNLGISRIGGGGGSGVQASPVAAGKQIEMEVEMQ